MKLSDTGSATGALAVFDIIAASRSGGLWIP
jgi:hypothetical protein